MNSGISFGSGPWELGMSPGAAKSSGQEVPQQIQKNIKFKLLQTYFKPWPKRPSKLTQVNAS